MGVRGQRRPTRKRASARIARRRASNADPLDPVRVTLRQVHDRLNAAFFGGVLEPVGVFRFEWIRASASGRGRVAAWELGPARRPEMVACISALEEPEALVAAVLHAMLHQWCAEPGDGVAAECQRYHSRAFKAAALAAGLRVPSQRDQSRGYAAAAVPRKRAGELRALSAQLRKAVGRLRGVPRPPRPSGKNLMKFECECVPPRNIRAWDADHGAMCTYCGQDYVEPEPKSRKRGSR